MTPSTASRTAALLLAVLLIQTPACDTVPAGRADDCEDAIGCLEIEPDAPVKIGVLQALSGEVASLGVEQVRGLELALARRGGRLLGHPVELVTEDTGCTPEGGANAALKLIADPEMAAIFGTTCSGAAATAAHAASSAGLTMISGNNSAPFLTSIAGHAAPDWHPGYFRTAANEENAGKAAALFAYGELGIRKAAVINDGDIYTKGLTEGFKKAFVQEGGEIVLDTSLAKGERDMRPFLEGVLLSGAELLFFPLFQPEGNRLLRAARQLPACRGVALMSDGALIENSFIKDMGDDAIGMYFVGPALPPVTEATERLLREYRETYKEDPSASYYMSAFDAAEILLNALEAAVSERRDHSLKLGRAALRRAVAATTGHNGVTGALSCDRFGDCAAPKFNILRLDDPGAGVGGLQRNILFSFAPK